MKKWMFALGIASLLVVGGCGEEDTSSIANEVAASESVVEEVDSTEDVLEETETPIEESETEENEVVEETDTTEYEETEEETSGQIVVSENGTLTEPVNAEGEGYTETQARDYYWTVTKPLMDDLNAQVNTLWQTHLIDAMPTSPDPEEWDLTFLSGLVDLNDSYTELIPQFAEIPTVELGEHEKRAAGYSAAMLNSLTERFDAATTIFDSVQESGNGLAKIDEYNAFVEDAMEFQEEALEHQRLLEEELGAVE